MKKCILAGKLFTVHRLSSFPALKWCGSFLAPKRGDDILVPKWGNGVLAPKWGDDVLAPKRSGTCRVGDMILPDCQTSNGTYTNPGVVAIVGLTWRQGQDSV